MTERRGCRIGTRAAGGRGVSSLRRCRSSSAMVRRECRALSRLRRARVQSDPVTFDPCPGPMTAVPRRVVSRARRGMKAHRSGADRMAGTSLRSRRAARVTCPGPPRRDRARNDSSAADARKAAVPRNPSRCFLPMPGQGCQVEQTSPRDTVGCYGLKRAGILRRRTVSRAHDPVVVSATIIVSIS